jgi:hypothetical protein
MGCGPARPPATLRFTVNPHATDESPPRSAIMNTTAAFDLKTTDRSFSTGPSFAAALCGFVSTTVATTMVMFLISSL